MNWFKVKVIAIDGDKESFEVPIQTHIQASVDEKFKDFIKSNPAYEDLLNKVGKYRIQSEHMNVHTWP